MLKSQSFIFYQATPLYHPPRSLPGFLCEEMYGARGVELHIGNNPFPQPVSLNPVLQMRNLGLREVQ